MNDATTKGIQRIDGADGRGGFDLTTTHYDSQSVTTVSSADGKAIVADLRVQKMFSVALINFLILSS